MSLLILITFFFSGAAGLIYEVVWNRLLTLVFGSTVFATSTILTTFMAGMALGGLYFGRFVDRHGNPLRIYAYLSAGVGAFAIILPVILSGANAIYVPLWRSLHANFYLLSLVKFLLCFAVLIVPTTLMGGTLPVVSKALTKRIDRLGKNISILYGINTSGAVLGCFSAGFVLIRTIGVSWTTYTASIINILIALVIISLSSKGRDASLEVEKTGGSNKKQGLNSPDTVRWLDSSHQSLSQRRLGQVFALIVSAVSGFCALSYEVLWTRVLVLFLGGTAYAFTTMLSSFLCGIAIGSLVVSRFVDRRNLLTILGIIQIGIALSAILLIPVFGSLYSIGMKFTGSGWSAFITSKFALSFLVMLIPTVLMGATFPIVVRMSARSLDVLGKSVGNVYSVNTLGSIFGSIFSGFVLIPLIGIRISIISMAVLNLAVGMSAIILNLAHPVERGRETRRLAFRASPLAVPILMIVIISASIDLGAPLTKKTAVFKGTGEKNKLLFYKEGVDACVTVVDDPQGIRRIFVDANQAAEDSRWDLPSHSIIGHLPILLHPNPKNALVIGFGMGVTSWSISRHGVQVDAIEISPGVVSANEYFSKINHNVLSEPLVHLIIDDGRNYVLATDKRYDMISTGIIHPLVSTNSAGFYTTDFYKLCQRVLTEDGIMCQWVPLHRLPEEQFKMIIRTFKAIFPHTTLWYKWTPDFAILIGTRNELRIDFEDFKRRMEKKEVKDDLSLVNMSDPVALLDSFMMDAKAIDQYVGEGPLHTDDRPRMEFFGPQAYGTTYQNLLGISRWRVSVLPYLTNIGKNPGEIDDVRDELQQYFDATQYVIAGQLMYAKGEFEGSLRQYLAASAINPLDDNVRWLISHLQEQMGITETALLEKIKVNQKDVDAHIKLGTYYQNQNMLDKAIAEFKKAIEIDPDSLIAHSNLAYIFESQGKFAEAVNEFKEILRIQPNLAPAHVGLGLLYQEQGMYDLAIEEMKKSLQLEPDSAVARINLGMMYHKKGMIDSAIEEFLNILKVQPDSAIVRGMLGDLYMEKGDLSKAEEEFRKALKLDPNLGLVYHSLALVLLKKGTDLDSALSYAKKAVELNPAPNFIATLARIYFQMKMYPSAEMEIKKAISIEPNNETYNALLEEIQKRRR